MSVRAAEDAPVQHAGKRNVYGVTFLTGDSCDSIFPVEVSTQELEACLLHHRRLTGQAKRTTQAFSLATPHEKRRTSKGVASDARDSILPREVVTYKAERALGAHAFPPSRQGFAAH
jgi:hypothetical protein